jgi:hypothetical protein
MFPSCHDKRFSLENSDPLIYTFRPSFCGADLLARQLGMPSDRYQIYCSMTFRGDRLCKTHPKYQNYAFEEFGLLLPSEDHLTDMTERPPNPQPIIFPYPTRYPRRARHWSFIGKQLLQVWRSRVFPFPFDRIRTLSSPFTVQDISLLHFEETWTPSRGLKRIIAGLSTETDSVDQDLRAFGRDALRILGYKVKTLGYEYEGRETFWRDLHDAYVKVRDRQRRKASREAVARELMIDRKTLRKYLDDFEISWPPP